METKSADLEQNFVIASSLPAIRSIAQCGNIHISMTCRFNWLQRFMWKTFFNVNIKNIK